jgi:hypothetical protein
MTYDLETIKIALSTVKKLRVTATALKELALWVFQCKIWLMLYNN